MTRFELNGNIYEANDKGTYFYKSTGDFDKKGNPIMRRVSKAVFEQAFDEYIEQANDEAEADEWEAEVEELKAEAEKVSKPRKSKDIAFEGVFETGSGSNFKVNKITLTKKQVRFLERLPEDDFFENGKGDIWIDVYCDTIADEFSPMAVGAMVSTLREKGIIRIGKDRVNGRICKFIEFTELGKGILKEMDLV